MIIEFSVGNYRSFNHRVTLSLVATSLQARDAFVDTQNKIEVDEDLTLLKAAAIYGANASGKSNLVAAVAFMRDFVINSARESQALDTVPIEPFRLSMESEGQPSYFEVVFLLEGKKFRYGFEVSTEEVVAEWLFTSGSQKETTLFTRDENGIKIGRSFKEGRGIQKRTRSNSLFLSVSAQFNGVISEQVLSWFRNLRIISGLEDGAHINLTLDLLQNAQGRLKLIDLVRLFDLGIDDMMSEKDEQSKSSWRGDYPGEAYNFFQYLSAQPISASIFTTHKRYDDKGRQSGIVKFKLLDQESHGTQKIVHMAGQLFDILTNGRVFFIDELDSRLHPLITAEIIRLFQVPESNSKNAQIVFTTHDTNLLSNQRFRRDQIWFTEKDRFGSTDLYALSELKIRNDASFEKDYIQGRYGAIPFLGNTHSLLLEEELE